MEYKKKYIAKGMEGMSGVESHKFDSEQEAIEWAYDVSYYGTWAIVPVIEFIND